MKLSCEIVQDLLPLYEDEACSGASRAAVEEHLRDCSACRAQMQTVRDFSAPEKAPRARGEDRAVVKSFRKIRRRWALSLIAVLLVIPLVMLTVNQVRQEGICFTNMDDVWIAYRYVRALEAEDWEAAAECLNYESLYQELQGLVEMEEADWLGEYEQVDLAGRSWQAKKYFYEDWLRNGTDELDFWIQVVLYRLPSVMVPLDIWKEVTARVPELTGEPDEIDRMVLEEEYIQLETQWGSFVATKDSGLDQCVTAEDFLARLSLIPEEIFLQTDAYRQTEAEEQYQYIQDYYGAVADMSLAEFTAYVQESYAADLAQMGKIYSFTELRYEDSYHPDWEDDWHIVFGVELSNGRESCHLSIEMRIVDGKVSVAGMSHRESISGLDDVCEMLFMGYPD